jgi:hypothetical protein
MTEHSMLILDTLKKQAESGYARNLSVFWPRGKGDFFIEHYYDPGRRELASHVHFPGDVKTGLSGAEIEAEWLIGRDWREYPGLGRSYRQFYRTWQAVSDGMLQEAATCMAMVFTRVFGATGSEELRSDSYLLDDGTEDDGVIYDDDVDRDDNDEGERKPLSPGKITGELTASVSAYDQLLDMFRTQITRRCVNNFLFLKAPGDGLSIEIHYDIRPRMLSVTLDGPAKTFSSFLAPTAFKMWLMENGWHDILCRQWRIEDDERLCDVASHLALLLKEAFTKTMEKKFDLEACLGEEAKEAPQPPQGSGDAFCGNCGARLAPGDRFCGGCGAPVDTP